MEPTTRALDLVLQLAAEQEDSQAIPYHLLKERIEYRLHGVALSEEAVSQLRTGVAKKVIFDSICGWLPLGPAVSTLLSANSQQQEAIKNRKQLILFEKLFERVEEAEKSISRIVNLISTPYGGATLSKLVAVAEVSLDEEQIDHLAAALDHILQNNFRDLFQTHRYALSQIEQMTPQALTLLADSGRWPEFYIASPSTAGTKIISDYIDPFARKYAEITYADMDSSDRKKLEGRLRHNISELYIRRYIEANVVAPDKARCSVTEVGKTLVPYLYTILSDPAP